MQLPLAEIAVIFHGLPSGFLFFDIDLVQSPHGHFLTAARPRAENHILNLFLILDSGVACKFDPEGVPALGRGVGAKTHLELII